MSRNVLFSILVYQLKITTSITTTKLCSRLHVVWQIQKDFVLKEYLRTKQVVVFLLGTTKVWRYLKGNQKPEVEEVPDSTMAKWKRIKWQTMINKTPHRLRITIPHSNRWLSSGAPEGYFIPLTEFSLLAPKYLYQIWGKGRGLFSSFFLFLLSALLTLEEKHQFTLMRCY